MDKLKLGLFSIVILGAIGGLAYWAVITMQSGSEYVNNQKIRKLETENEDLKQQVEKLNSELAASDTLPKPADVVKEETPKPTTPVKKPATTTYKNQTLINELQKLANAGIVLKLKSAGPSVGTVQKFINVYKKTSNKIDNDYGASTKTAVAAFQKAEGITSSGEAGKTTFTKMIAWLKKQG
ncbi:MAG TPA: peptidoglycan-binding protein [Candidatus Paceibacterota bacterium]|jgi:murein L,D-transpeptidase YcbB/YkuD|nr:peptidoglycan-binding protein [Candidatus Paceibacterota bacterium]